MLRGSEREWTHLEDMRHEAWSVMIYWCICVELLQGLYGLNSVLSITLKTSSGEVQRLSKPLQRLLETSVLETLRGGMQGKRGKKKERLIIAFSHACLQLPVIIQGYMLI